MPGPDVEAASDVTHHRVAAVDGLGVARLAPARRRPGSPAPTSSPPWYPERTASRPAQHAPFVDPGDHLGHVARRPATVRATPVAGVVGEVHGQHRPHLDPQPHQRERRRAVADVPVGDRGLDGQDRGHGRHCGTRHADFGPNEFASDSRPFGPASVPPDLEWSPCRPASRAAGARDPERGPARRCPPIAAVRADGSDHRWASRANLTITIVLIEPEEDRWRWRRRIRQNPRQARGVPGRGRPLPACCWSASASSAGPLPGPGGIPLVLLGVAVWSSEFEWAYRLHAAVQGVAQAGTGPGPDRKQVLFWVVFVAGLRDARLHATCVVWACRSGCPTSRGPARDCRASDGELRLRSGERRVHCDNEVPMRTPAPYAYFDVALRRLRASRRRPLPAQPAPGEHPARVPEAVALGYRYLETDVHADRRRGPGRLPRHACSTA